MPISPQGVSYEIVAGGGKTPDGFVPYEARFWDSEARRIAGDGKYVIDGQPADLVNNFKMQIREGHQRVVRLPGDDQFPEGYTRHVSGLAIPNRVVADADALRTFLAGQFLPLDGYAPFRFPNYAGVEELLDGMWQHETHTVPLLGQAEANVERYIAVAKRERWEGDKRGTTLNLQVGASADDGYSEQTPVFDATGINARVGARTSARLQHNSWARFTPVSGLFGATIDSAAVSYWEQFAGLGSNLTKIFAEDATAPAAPTDKTDHDGKTRTTAGVDWDAMVLNLGSFTDSPSIVTVIQELADSYDSNVIQILHDDDGSSTAGNNFAFISTYDEATAEAAKLDITFTAPVTGDPVIIEMF